jgi:deoxyribodipyrimidine photo-lyase
MEQIEISVFWFRRDLRLNDNHGLYQALKSGLPVLPLFIFDSHILDELSVDDKRVALIYNQLLKLNTEFRKFKSSLQVEYGTPKEVFEKIINRYSIKQVYTNEDYEPYAIERDRNIESLLSEKGIGFKSFQDQILVHPEQIKKSDGKPYTIFTPWSKKWRQKFDLNNLNNYPSEEHLQNLYRSDIVFPELKQLGFQEQSISVNTEFPNTQLLMQYEKNRDFPFLDGTSRLSVALRFGMVSIRKLASYSANSFAYINELGWREFYMMVIYFYPKVVVQSFKSQYDKIIWRNDNSEFEHWKNGETGYPIVDAGMRQLKETGYMHNRLRMITASFLTKHLLIDWRWGENWFAEKLLDFELASNNGGWQWAAGTGCDAAPYFRVFNPSLQTKKFDAQFEFIKKWVPEFNSLNYSKPIVDHAFARQRAIDTYKNGLQ